MHRGYTKLWRKILDHPLHPLNRNREWTSYEAMLDLIQTAHSKDEPKKLWVNGKIVEIGRGELDITNRQLASRWRWSLGKTNRFLNVLKMERSIDIKVNARFSVIAIVNYDIYNPLNERSRSKNGTENERKMNANGTLYNECNDTNESNEERESGKNPTTPAQLAKLFFEMVKNKSSSYQEFILSLSSKKNLNVEKVRAEIDKFTKYWTERTPSGKKEKWELEKTFEVDGRLGTWFSRVQTFSSNSRPNSGPTVIRK